MSLESGAGCGGHHSRAMSLESALEAIRGSVSAVIGNDEISPMEALGRVLAEDIRAPNDVPGHTNSAMDGYAFRHEDCAPTGKAALRIAGDSFAGHPFSGALQAGECVRIMTGAVVPDAADTVVMQEDVVQREGMIELSHMPRKGANIRLAGEDIQAGQAVLSAGRVLRPADLGMIASMGIASLKVRRRVKVAFFSTGDELRPVGEPLLTGQIHDSNRYTLHGMLCQAGMDTCDMGIVKDDPDALRDAFKTASESADVVITSGGVSVGEADYVTDMLAEMGNVSFWQIAMKPGRPLVYGRLGSAVFFGLPGNPVSVMATFMQVVRPALGVISGARYEEPLRFDARTEHAIRKKPGRMEFQRGILRRDGKGGFSVKTTGHQGSGILKSMSEANCFIVLPQDSGTVEAGTWVTVEPFPCV